MDFPSFLIFSDLIWKENLSRLGVALTATAQIRRASAGSAAAVWRNHFAAISFNI
jgi:hypothetical protein